MQQQQRTTEALPVIERGIPLLLQVDPYLDLDVLREKFAFEIVSEQEEGYVIVAAEDIAMTTFAETVANFAVEIRGSATIAKVHRLDDDVTQNDRLSRILSERLMTEWPRIADDVEFVVDIGIACTGTLDIPDFPKRGRRDDDARWAVKEAAWSQARAEAYNAWDDLKMEREGDIGRFCTFYGAEILSMIDGVDFAAGVLPDSFTVRMKILGSGLKDFVLNYPYIFEVVEPEDIALPQIAGQEAAAAAAAVEPVSPAPDAPAVCVIDSGIQEGHSFLQPAIDAANSRCFLPDRNPDDVADEVAPGGHGTRVAGAVLFGEEVPKAGAPQLPFWLQNARVLDQNNRMPEELFPPAVIRQAIEHFNSGPRATRVFNHSINAQGYSRTRYMSAWAAEIDMLSCERDILIVQSAGNLPLSATAPMIGIAEHLAAGRVYPEYLNEPSARVANPGQSLQALTVGSVAYGNAVNGEWRSFAEQEGGPSAFSRSGPVIWNVIKPEVVTYGGDAARTTNMPPDLQGGGAVPTACPELLRSTLHGPGPAYDRDDAGTSYAAPKVARIAARLQTVLPDEPALLYRALIVQSARWPDWAEDVLAALRRTENPVPTGEREQLQRTAAGIIRQIGYGIPDEDRASANTDYRTTFITAGECTIRAGECQIYQVPIPQALRRPGDDFEVRLEVTLSYAARPRRTRRNLRRYLSTWVDWKSSKLGEGLNDFRIRAMREVENENEPLRGEVLPWTLHEMKQHGLIRDFRRNSGTVQKDWAVVKSNALPDHFCIAVVGHRGWSRDPDSRAKYVLAVTFELLGQEIAIYEPLRTAVLELQVQVEQPELETEVDVDVDVDVDP